LDQRREGLSEREEKLLRALQRRRKRLEHGRFIAEGIRVVEDLLASPLEVDWVLVASSLEDTSRGATLVASIEERALPIRVLPDDAFQKLALTEQAQGVLAVAQTPAGDWRTIESSGTHAVVLLLDGVQDPGNLGTLARTAEALGAAGLVTLPGTVDPWNPKTVRAAAGSLFRIPVLAGGWEEVRDRLRKEGFRLLTAEVGGDPPPAAGGRVGLVVGNEGAGISPEVRASADGAVGIPLRGRAESLNVAAAAAILLYELTR
jgi:RNA methyltransferase, TrmH family